MQKPGINGYRRLGAILPLLLSGCVSLGPNPSPIVFPSQVETRKFTECMAPLAASAEPAFRALIDHVKARPPSEAFSERMRPLLDLDAGFFENKWNLKSRLEELIAKLGTDMQLRKPSGELIPILGEEYKWKVQNDIKSFKGDIVKSAQRTEAYVLAYFTKSANPIPFGFDADDQTRIAAKLAKHFNRKPDDPAIVAALGEISPDVQGLVGSLNRTLADGQGFVGREGTVYAFPGVAETRSGGVSIDHSQVGADFIRILFESLRDTYAPLPVLTDSTAAWLIHQCDSPSHKHCEFKGDKLAELSFRDRDEQDIEWNPDKWGRLQPYRGKITRSEFEEIEAKARRSESSTAEVVGKAIRGGSWGALNNEAVAKTVETAAGVLARHATERAGWCAKYSGVKAGS